MRRYGWFIGFTVVYLLTADLDPAIRMDLLFPFVVGVLRRPNRGWVPLLLWAAIGIHHPGPLLIRLVILPFAVFPLENVYVLQTSAVALVYAATLYEDPWRAMMTALYVALVMNAGHQKLRLQDDINVPQQSAAERSAIYAADHDRPGTWVARSGGCRFPTHRSGYKSQSKLEASKSA